jgi:putative transposase
VTCRALGVSRSWYYKWKAGTLPPRAQRRERLKAEVARLLAVHEGKYGSPRITADLRDAGVAGDREHRPAGSVFVTGLPSA